MIDDIPANEDNSSESSQRKTTSVDAHVGMQLRRRRVFLGVSQELLGQDIGLTFQQIQKYENGRNRISASRLYQIARRLNVSLDYFFEGMTLDGPMPLTDDRERETLELMSSREGIMLAKAYTSVPDPTLRRSLLRLIVNLADLQIAAPQGRKPALDCDG